MFPWSRRDRELDTRVVGCEGGKIGFQERALNLLVEWMRWFGVAAILHSPATPGMVAIMEVQALALENECADTIL